MGGRPGLQPLGLHVRMSLPFPTLDVTMCLLLRSPNRLYLGDGTGTNWVMTKPSWYNGRGDGSKDCGGWNTQHVEAADLNGDGYLDLVTLSKHWHCAAAHGA